MTDTILVEKDLPQPPEKIWRALTESHLLADWLMANNFRAEVGHRFTFRMPPMPRWNGVTDCVVTEVIPITRPSYSWCSSGEEAATGVSTTVTWTLEPLPNGTRLTMRQSGFRRTKTGLKAARPLVGDTFSPDSTPCFPTHEANDDLPRHVPP